MCGSSSVTDFSSRANMVQAKTQCPSVSCVCIRLVPSINFCSVELLGAGWMGLQFRREQLGL